MNNQSKRWEILNKSKINSLDQVIDILLKNRNIADQKLFFNPLDPTKISITELGVDSKSLKKAILRIEKAKKNSEQVIVYGDYDADGICATAIMWEALHSLDLDVLPHVPDRFEEGYGINQTSVENLKHKIKNLKLIITVDNGIVAYDGISKANELGIDVIVIDHHTKGSALLDSYSTIHSTQTSGSGLAWFFAKELGNNNALELAAIGVIADQLPLTDVNRSIVKHGLEKLNTTRRPGLVALYNESGIIKESGQSVSVGTYEVGFMVAPRINAMGRLKHGIESLRLLCTKDAKKATDIAKNIGNTNIDRQKIVEQVVIQARKNVTDQKVIVISGEDYHEGVIGLAAGRITEEFYRPSVVLSIKGDISKASARSISGFNIIDAIRAVNLHLEGGGHPMAAGFSIETNKIEEFAKEINKYAANLLTDDLLQKKLKIDCEINFDLINYSLYNQLLNFDPTGLGNPTPVFATKKVTLVSVKPVGRESKHLKLKVGQGEQVFDAIFFGGGEMYSSLKEGSKIDLVYNIDDNSWNGYKNLQLKIKDIKF